MEGFACHRASSKEELTRVIAARWVAAEEPACTACGCIEVLCIAPERPDSVATMRAALYWDAIGSGILVGRLRTAVTAELGLEDASRSVR
jgi:hypothetical protein